MRNNSVSVSFDPEIHAQRAESISANFWYLSRNEIILRTLERSISAQPSTILELGAGTGFVTRALKRAYPDSQVTAIEPHMSGIDVAKRLGGIDIEYVHGTLSDLSADRRFDVIGAFDVLEHIEDDVGTLKELAARLSDSGVMIFTVPQHQALWSQKDVRVGHVRRYACRELEEKIREIGGEILFSSSFMFFLLPVLYLKRVLASKKHDHVASDGEVPQIINRVFRMIMRAEEQIIRLGIRFPIGGSRIIIARFGA